MGEFVMVTLLYCLIYIFFIPYCLSKGFDSSKEHISKNNIVRVKVMRVNSYGYSGGMIDIYKSNKGLIQLEFKQPRDSWGVYIFDLNSIDSLSHNTIFEEYEKYKTVLSNEDQQEVYIVDGDTLNESELVDRIYSRRIATIDTLSYVKHIVDTAILTGKGALPHLFYYNHQEDFGDDIVYYIRLNDKIRSWEDCCLYRYGLVDECLSPLTGGFFKITLPGINEPGFVDTLQIKTILVNGLHTFQNENKTYECMQGFLIFQDIHSKTYFVSGHSLFPINIQTRLTSEAKDIVNLGHSVVMPVMSSGKTTYELYNSSFPNGKILPFTDSVIFYSNKYLQCVGPGCYPERLDYAYVKLSAKHILLFTNDATTRDIPEDWKLIKPIGDKPDIPEIKDKKIREFLSLFSPSFSNKLIFMAPKNKIMIYGDGKFFELTKKKIKEMGG